MLTSAWTENIAVLQISPFCVQDKQFLLDLVKTASLWSVKATMCVSYKTVCTQAVYVDVHFNFFFLSKIHESVITDKRMKCYMVKLENVP